MKNDTVFLLFVPVEESSVETEFDIDKPTEELEITVSCTDETETKVKCQDIVIKVSGNITLTALWDTYFELLDPNSRSKLEDCFPSAVEVNDKDKESLEEGKSLLELLEFRNIRRVRFLIAELVDSQDRIAVPEYEGGNEKALPFYRDQAMVGEAILEKVKSILGENLKEFERIEYCITTAKFASLREQTKAR